MNWAGAPWCPNTARPGRPDWIEFNRFALQAQPLPLFSRHNRHALAQDAATSDTTFHPALAANTGLASGAVVTFLHGATPQRILLVLVSGIVQAAAPGRSQARRPE